MKVVDFGLAKFVLDDHAEASELTRSGAIMGTVLYMSPEQLEGEAADERSDVFSLGVVTVEMLTGSRPFRGRTPFELLRAINKCFVFSPDSPFEPLSRVLAKCLAKNREQRFASVAAMQAELIPLLRSLRPSPANETAKTKVL